ncbi:CopG family transcriptional regulator [Populibacterium corticicola]|uniref:CopG family transcriptional regulator n=1 Tax=Populibacterium corticicola TaxID=1812826 RepID=A0ABW5XD44_9MICO
MGEYKDVDRVPFTDEDIEEWAAEAETSTGYTGKHLGLPVAGDPTSADPQTHTIALHLDTARLAKLNEAAQKRHTTPSQLMRELIDAL